MKFIKSVAFLFCLTSTIANAQSGSNIVEIDKTVLCSSTRSMLETLNKPDIQEIPIWVGQSDDQKSNYTVFMNTKTGSFTVLQFNPEWACILGMGERSYQINLDKTTTKLNH